MDKILWFATTFSCWHLSLLRSPLSDPMHFIFQLKLYVDLLNTLQYQFYHPFPVCRPFKEEWCENAVNCMCSFQWTHYTHHETRRHSMQMFHSILFYCLHPSIGNSFWYNSIVLRLRENEMSLITIWRTLQMNGRYNFQNIYRYVRAPIHTHMVYVCMWSDFKESYLRYCFKPAVLNVMW